MEALVQLSSLLNEEMEYRRFLFKIAADGDLRAQQKLEREYHVRVRPKSNPPRKAGRLNPKASQLTAE